MPTSWGGEDEGLGQQQADAAHQGQNEGGRFGGAVGDFEAGEQA